MTTQSPDATEQVERIIEQTFAPHGYELKPHLLKAAARAILAALPSNATTNASLVQALESIRDVSSNGYDSDRAWALAMQLRARCALIERLRMMARQSSETSKMMAQSKSLRQAGHEPSRDDLYMWATPEQTTEWKAASTLEDQANELEDLRGIVKVQVEVVAQLEDVSRDQARLIGECREGLEGARNQLITASAVLQSVEAWHTANCCDDDVANIDALLTKLNAFDGTPAVRLKAASPPPNAWKPDE